MLLISQEQVLCSQASAHACSWPIACRGLDSLLHHLDRWAWSLLALQQFRSYLLGISTSRHGLSSALWVDFHGRAWRESTRARSEGVGAWMMMDHIMASCHGPLTVASLLSSKQRLLYLILFHDYSLLQWIGRLLSCLLYDQRGLLAMQVLLWKYPLHASRLPWLPMVKIMYGSLLRPNWWTEYAINHLRVALVGLYLHYVVEDLHHPVALVVVALRLVRVGGAPRATTNQRRGVFLLGRESGPISVISWWGIFWIQLSVLLDHRASVIV